MAQTPRHPIRTVVALSVAFWLTMTVAKTILVVERHGLQALWSPAELGLFYFRDAVVGLLWASVVAAVAWVTKGHRKGMMALWLVAGAGIVYICFNIVFFRLFSTPLNRSLLAMAGGTGEIAETAAAFFTFNNLWPFAVCLLTLTAVPLGMRRLERRGTSAVGGLTGLLVLLVGIFAFAVPSERPAIGLDRNALWEAALLPFPRKTVMEEIERLDIGQPLPRGSIVDPDATVDDLSDLRGVAQGMNVVLVVLESTHAKYIGAYGEDDDPMPRVSALTRNSMVFNNWYAPVPTSMKCMFSYLCSTYPYPDGAAESILAPRIPCNSWPEVLADQGYNAGLVTSAHFSFNRKTQFLADRGFTMLEDAESLASDEFFSNNWGIEEDAALERMVAWLGEQPDDEPFFLTYVPIFPHYPYDVPLDEPGRFGDDRKFDKYRAGMSHTDRVVGELFDHIEASGRMDDTLFIVIGDHGEAFEQHVGNKAHGNAIYEENVHVPAMVYNRRLFPDERRVERPADHTALAPTVLDMLGVEKPGRWQGISLVEGRPDMARFVVDASFLLLGLRDGPYKYIHDLPNGFDELYDLTNDPGETRNLADDFPELVTQYREHLIYHYHHQIGLFEDYEGYLQGTLVQGEKVELEDLAPVAHEMGWGKMMANVSIGKHPLNIGGRPFSDGLGTHAPGFVRYELRGRYEWFDGSVGRDLRSVRGECLAEIWVDGIRVWASEPMRRAGLAQPFHIDVSGAQELELVLLEGSDGGRGDHIDWVDVVLY